MGATNNYPTDGNIQLFDGANVPAGTFQSTYGRSAVNNANQDAPPQNFFSSGPQPKDYTNYYPGSPLKGLLVPVSGNVTPNYWHYDASSPNRHNLSSYDLWAEYIGGNKGGSNIIITNGNWQQ